MSGKPKNNILAPEEMRAVETRGGRLYSQTADRGIVVSAIVSELAEELANLPKKIDLKDEKLVGKVAVAYVNACAEAGTLPTKTGLCRAFGITRQSVDYFLKQHYNEPSAELLTLIFDSFAEALNTASLASAVHPIVSIFLSKAIYNYTDTLKIETNPGRDPLGDRLTQSELEEIAGRYTPPLDLPD